MAVQHGTITGDAVHVPYAGSFANAAARTGATGLDSTQHGKLFRQLDDNSLWMLVNTSPLTWKPLTPDNVASAEYADNAGYANNAGTLNGKAEGSLSVNYANSAGSVSSIGGVRASGVIKKCGNKVCLYAPAGGQYAVFYDQQILIAKGSFPETDRYVILSSGVYAGGALAAQSAELKKQHTPVLNGASDFYRI